MIIVYFSSVFIMDSVSYTSVVHKVDSNNFLRDVYLSLHLVGAILVFL